MSSLPPLTWKTSPNFSARGGGGKITLIVIHDTEGSYGGAVSWFASLSSHVSAHIILSEDGKTATQTVKFADKAWHACWYNSCSIGIEMAGFESKGFSEQEWESEAAIVAYLCHRFNVPIVWAKGGSSRGIARHFDLGVRGGGHKDPSTDPAKMQYFMGLVAKAWATTDWPTIPWGQ